MRGGCKAVFWGLLRRVVGSGVWARGVAAGLTLEACRFPDLSVGKVRRHCLGTLNARAGVPQSSRGTRTYLSSFLVELDASSGIDLPQGARAHPCASSPHRVLTGRAVGGWC